MLKYVAAIALGSSLLVAPAISQADQSTSPPSPYSDSTPGNGPSYNGPDSGYYGMREGRSAFIQRDNNAGYGWSVPSVEDQTYFSRGR